MTTEIREVSPNKFHSLLYELGVGFEVTFPLGFELKFDPNFAFPGLLHYQPGETVRRVHCPATTVGDVLADGKAQIHFVPWVDDEGSVFHRIGFRLQPKSRSSVCRKMQFARFGEEKPFGFDPARRGGQFINLNFLGYDAQEFVPLYLKVETDAGLLKYYQISAKAGEQVVTVEIQEVSAETAPEHLQKVVL